MSDALDQVRSQLATTTLGRRFCAHEFMISQLREVYEAMWGTQLDAADFQRKVPESDGFLTPLKKWRRSAGWGGQPGRVGEWGLGGCRGRLRRGGEGGVSLPCRKSTQHTTRGDKER